MRRRVSPFSFFCDEFFNYTLLDAVIDCGHNYVE
jgi:hypothetical protein